MASVKKTEAGVWRVRWRYGGTRTGADQVKTYRTQREANALKRAVEERGHLVRARDPEVRDGTLVKGTPQTRATRPQGHTFGDAARGLMETKGSIRVQTRREYQRLLDTYLLPRWGEVQVVDVSEADLSALITDLGIVKSSNGSGVWMLARMVLRYAQRKGMRPDDPSMGMRLPAASEGPAVFLTPEERLLILDAAGKHPSASDVWVPFVRVALEAGLRQSEVSGLQVRDLDVRKPERPLLHVRRGYRPAKPLRDGGTGKALVPPKSAKSVRTVTIDPMLAGALLPFTVGRSQTAPLLPGARGGHTSSSTVQHRWATTVRLAGAAGLGCSPRFHDLRHTHASYLLEELGLSLEYVSKRLGHSDIQTTYRYYVHLTTTSEDAYLAAVRRNGERHLRAV
jgi:integrase